jgi:hypothetical protein
MITTPMEFSPAQPPFVPQLSWCPPYLFNYVPAIASAVASQAGRNVVENPHPGRIFTFNELAKNNWANQEFGQAVATAVDYIALHIHKGVYPTPEQAIADCIHRVLAMITSMNIMNNTDMHYLLDHAIINEARRVTSTEAVQIMHEVTQMKMGTAAPNPHSMGLGGGYTAPQQARPIVSGGMRPGQYGHHPRQSGQIMGQGFQHQASGPVTTTPAPAAATGRYGHLLKGTQPQTQQTQQPVEVALAPVAPTLEDWTPSNLQQFPPAFDLYREYADISQQYDARSSSVVNVIAIKPKESEMDRSQHSFSPFPAQGGSNAPREKRTTEILEEQQERIEKLPRTVIPKFGDVVVATERGIWKPVTSLKDAIFLAKFERDLARRSNPKLSAHTEFMLLTTHYNTIGNQRHVIEFLAESKTLQELGHNLGMRIMEFEGMNEQMDFVQGLRTYVTREFNLFLRNRCCVSGVSISDYPGDIPELPAYLAKNRGEMYATALELFQKDWLKQLFEILDDNSYEALVETIMPPVDEGDSPMNYATATFRGITVSVLDVLDRDLNLGFPLDEFTAMADIASHPTLVKFGRSLIDLSGTDKVSEVNIAHHYIVTSDNVIYELTPSPSAKNDGIIVSKITL